MPLIRVLIWLGHPIGKLVQFFFWLFFVYSISGRSLFLWGLSSDHGYFYFDLSFLLNRIEMEMEGWVFLFEKLLIFRFGLRKKECESESLTPLAFGNSWNALKIEWERRPKAANGRRARRNKKGASFTTVTQSSRVLGWRGATDRRTRRRLGEEWVEWCETPSPGSGGRRISTTGSSTPSLNSVDPRVSLTTSLFLSHTHARARTVLHQPMVPVDPLQSIFQEFLYNSGTWQIFARRTKISGILN